MDEVKIVQCKICGKESKRLGAHVKAAHKLSHREYHVQYILNGRKIRKSF